MVGLKLSGWAAVLAGLAILVLCLVYIVTATALEGWAQDLPVVGGWLLEVMQKVVYFPGAQYVFPLLGLFNIFWGVSILRMETWARLAGPVHTATWGSWILGATIVACSLDEVQKVRWWVLLVGVLAAAPWFYWACLLLFSKQVRWAFAQRYYEPKDLDLPMRRESASLPPTPAPGPVPVSQEDKRPELARLTPRGGGAPFVVRDARTTIGREGTQLLLDPNDTSISRSHATITQVGAGFELEDVSRNGTVVDGQKVLAARVPLRDGVEIQFGRQARFRFNVAPSRAAGSGAPGGAPAASRPASSPASPGKSPAAALSGSARPPAAAPSAHGTAPAAAAGRPAAMPQSEPMPSPAGSIPSTPASSPAQSAPQPAVRVLARLEPKGATAVPFDLVNPRHTIGRDPARSDLQLPRDLDTTVSGLHAEFVLEGGRFLLRDRSTNGTFVNETQVTETELHDGDEIRLGLAETSFAFRVAG